MKTIVSVFICCAFAGSAIAADYFELPASKGKVTFPHKKHQDMLKDCIKCHENGPGKIVGLNQDWAHRICRGCHAEMKKGPVKCSDCHQEIS